MHAQLETPVIPSHVPRPRVTNRLILFPNDNHEGPVIAQEQVISLVQRLGTIGETFVYVAHQGCREAADDEFGVRFLPFTHERLPCFHSVELVLVVNDKNIAAAAAAEYPEAAIYHIEPAFESVHADVTMLRRWPETCG